MGMFDKLLGTREINLTPQAGLLLAAISMTAIDGDIDDDELAIIRRLDGSRSTVAWEAALEAWKRNSLEDCVNLVAGALNHGQRLGAIANLIDIAMADGYLAGAEKDLLERYVNVLQVDQERVEKMAEVIAIKNNREVFLE